MHRRVLSVVLCVALIVAVLGIAGCQEIAETAAEKAVKGATGVDVDSDSGEVTFEGKDGNSTTIDTENATVPKGWPEAAPVYDGTITASFENEYEGKTSYQLVVETDDDQADVHAWFESELEKNGWTIETNMKTDSGGMIIAVKDDLRFTTATGNGDEKKWSISEMVAPKE